MYSSDADIAGFQFNVDGATVLSASGGDAAANGFTVSTSASVVLGFSFTGSTIPAGSGVLTTLEVQGDPCLSGLVLSGVAGTTLSGAVDDCLTITYSAPCDDADGDDVCDDVDDCVGAYDECGVCNGDGIADGACDCAGNVLDCNDECGGSAVVDECDVCDGDGSSCAGECTDDVCLSLDGGNLVYSSDVDIAGFQFNHDGCVTGASGGQAAANGFTVSVSDVVVLGFSFTGSTVPALSLIHI